MEVEDSNDSAVESGDGDGMIEDVKSNAAADGVEEQTESSVYLPHQHKLEDGEELEMDHNAYRMYHALSAQAPCLSFDVVRDNLGDNRESFPLSCLLVCGTQAATASNNSIIVMKLSNLTELNHDEKDKDDKDEDEDDDEASDSDDEDSKPVLDAALVRHNGTVNRIRCCTSDAGRPLAATWSELGYVYIWDLSRPLAAVEDADVMAEYTRTEESPAPCWTYRGHGCEGYSMAWCTKKAGRLATGDTRGGLHLWEPTDNCASWAVRGPLAGHTASLEDVQWSPTEPNVLVSCSVDRSLRVWDIRCASAKACRIVVPEAHDSDVNVVHWNTVETCYLASGGDDGVIKVWDLRRIGSTGDSKATPAAAFRHHRAPITSVEWHPSDASVLAATGEDDQLSIWDLAVEVDATGDTDCSSAAAPADVPPQLLFIHMGQSEMKEVHWHPQLPGVLCSTAHDGFNIFRTISV